MTWYVYNNRGVPQQPGLPDALPVGLITALVSVDNPSYVPPAGWLVCNGGTHSTATYPELAAILAYPAAPGGTFAVPNLNTRFVVGSSGTYPLKSTGGENYHDHVVNGHTHSNDHQHGVTGTHTHTANHWHNGGDHTHGNGSYVSGTATTSVNTQYTADTFISPPSHTHAIGGNTGGANDTTQMLASINPHTSGAGGAGTSGSSTVNLDSGTPTITPFVPGADILPPYLNVYYIIKAVDLSGTYI